MPWPEECLECPLVTDDRSYHAATYGRKKTPDIDERKLHLQEMGLKKCETQAKILLFNSGNLGSLGVPLSEQAFGRNFRS